MDVPTIREDLVRRLCRRSRAQGLAMTELVNLSLEACINHEEQQMATDQTGVKTLEAVLVRAILRSAAQGHEGGRRGRIPGSRALTRRPPRGSRPAPGGRCS
jgi:hypothetical protein